jgi:hypothetical protein
MLYSNPDGVSMPEVGADRVSRARGIARGPGGRSQGPRVVDAIARVPREAFVPPELGQSAYENMPLPIGYGQTISQPVIIALMTESAPSRRQRECCSRSGPAQVSDCSALFAGRACGERRADPTAGGARQGTAGRAGYGNVEVHVGARSWDGQGQLRTMRSLSCRGARSAAECSSSSAQAEGCDPRGSRDLQSQCAS